MNRIPLALLLIRTALFPWLNRAPIRRRALHGRIVNVIARALATVPFERVQQTHPVALLVHGGHAGVVAGHGARGHCVGVYVASVVEVRGGIGFVGCDG